MIMILYCTLFWPKVQYRPQKNHAQCDEKAKNPKKYTTEGLLNYEKYLSDGDKKIDMNNEYNSHNTERLDVDGTFTKEKMKFSPEEMAEVAAAIAANM